MPEKLNRDNVVLNQANDGGRTFHAMFATTICLGLCLCVTPLMFAPFDPFHCFVPNQFEPVATVAVYGHCKQSLTHEVNQSADTK